MSDINLSGPTDVPWLTPEKLDAMKPYERALWAVKALSTDEKFMLTTHIIRELQEEVAA